MWSWKREYDCRAQCPQPTDRKTVARCLYEGVLYIYYHLFYHLEECVVLDPANPSDLDILHYVFVPRINRHLSIWKGGYIHHRIRTAGSR